jgi:hypothetical protein
MEQTADADVKVGEIPQWSGVPTFLGPDWQTAIVPLHVSDARPVKVPGYEHVDYYEALDGEVEYHIYQRC